MADLLVRCEETVLLRLEAPRLPRTASFCCRCGPGAATDHANHDNNENYFSHAARAKCVDKGDHANNTNGFDIGAQPIYLANHRASNTSANSVAAG